jgi:hypothetical protein
MTLEVQIRNPIDQGNFHEVANITSPPYEGP